MLHRKLNYFCYNYIFGYTLAGKRFSPICRNCARRQGRKTAQRRVSIPAWFENGINTILILAPTYNCLLPGATCCPSITSLGSYLHWSRSTASHMASSTYVSSRVMFKQITLVFPLRMKEKELRKLVTGILAMEHVDLE